MGRSLPSKLRVNPSNKFALRQYILQTTLTHSEFFPKTNPCFNIMSCFSRIVESTIFEVFRLAASFIFLEMRWGFFVEIHTEMKF